jgi:iron complex outermembrane receptor protein
MAKVALGGGWRLHAGLFVANRQQDSAFADLLIGVTPDGRASRVVIADPGPQDAILSGELRLIREWRAGALSHSLTASLRGRRKNRRFGGSETVSLGSGPIDDPAAWPARAPAFAYRPQDEDRVRQLAAGLSYNLLWQGRASLDVGVSQGFYRKNIDFADPRLADTRSRDRPLLWNLSASVSLSDRLIAFAGLSRGQEDAVIAPDVAVNRSEAPPAIRTRQVEAGLRFALAERLALVVGAFEIARPYYNLDPGLRYRELGRLTNRGLEFSLTGQVAPGLSVVGGLLFADPKISGEAVASGLIGQRPVGQVRRRLAANIDWRTRGGKGPLSFDLYVESFSSRVGNVANTLVAPPRTQMNFGARYRFNLAGARVILRPQVINLFNAYGWQVSSSGGFTYSTGRFGSLALTADW